MQDNLSSSIVVENEQKGVLRIIFSNLPSNSMPIDLLQELAMTIENLGEDENVQAIILQSGGERTFCSGADFNQLLQIEDEKSGKIFFNGFAKVINACRNPLKLSSEECKENPLAVVLAWQQRLIIVSQRNLLL